MIPKRKQFLAVNVSRRDEDLHKGNDVVKSVFFLFSALLKKIPMNIMTNNLLCMKLFHKTYLGAIEISAGVW